MILLSGVFMILMGIIGKIGAIFTTIPNPVVGGMFMVAFGVIGATGISNLQVKKYFRVILKSLFKTWYEIFAHPSPFKVHRYEFLEEHIYLWFFHVLCIGHP